MRKLLSIPAMLAALALGAHAQTLILSSVNGTTGAYSVTWPGAVFGTLHTGAALNNVRTQYDNRGHYFASDPTTGGSSLLQVRVTGIKATIAAFTAAEGRMTDFELDQDSEWVCTFNSGLVLHGETAFTTLAVVSSPGYPNCISRDPSSGDFVVGTNNGRLIRIDRNSGAQSTLKTGLGLIQGLDFAANTGNYLICTSTATLIMNRAGSVLTTIPISNGTAITVDEATHRIFVAGNTGGVTEVSSSGTIVKSKSFPGYMWSGIDVARDQEVRIKTSGLPGTNGFLGLAFPNSPNARYCAAMSLDFKPAIQIAPNSFINLKPDVLFFYTLCGRLPLFTERFSGALNSAGFANARFTLPGLPATPFTLYLTAAAVNPSFPGGLDVGNFEVIKVQ